MPQPAETLTDYLTSRPVPNIGPEANRQAVIRYLIEEAGYRSEELETNGPISVAIEETRYASRVDIVVSNEGEALMLVKCAAGSLGSREREALAAARLVKDPPLPLTLVSDGQAATLLVDALVVGQGTPDDHLAADLGTFDLIQPQHDMAIVEQQGVATRAFLVQSRIGATDPFLVSLLRIPGRIDAEAFTRLELDPLALEAGDTDLGPLQVHQYADLAAAGTRPVAHPFGTLLMLSIIAMRHVQPHHVNAGGDDFIEYLGVVRGRPHGRDNLRSS